ncbi:MAG TPA: sigma-54-dependent Fis family transcriptional regulator, partial [Flavobacteriaceae bacterium]|nr:sigma-54-dependent Fis family transcriptional regulator [Flavobacteriaceae bacterium]
EENTQRLIQEIYREENDTVENLVEIISPEKSKTNHYDDNFQDAVTIEETLSLQEKEYEMIKKALDRNLNKRKLAAKELGISERTLYRKIKQYDL